MKILLLKASGNRMKLSKPNFDQCEGAKIHAKRNKLKRYGRSANIRYRAFTLQRHRYEFIAFPVDF